MGTNNSQVNISTTSSLSYSPLTTPNISQSSAKLSSRQFQMGNSTHKTPLTGSFPSPAVTILSPTNSRSRPVGVTQNETQYTVDPFTQDHIQHLLNQISPPLNTYKGIKTL